MLDANVLYPFQLRNLLLHMVTEALFEPLWSEQILTEARRNLLKNGIMDEKRWGQMETLMRRHFASAYGSGFEPLIDGLKLPDKDDRHVLALAVHYEADVIVTYNMNDFPLKVLKPLGVDLLEPRPFVQKLWDQDPAAVYKAAEAHRVSLSKSALNPAEYLGSLRKYANLPELAAQLDANGFTESGRRRR